MSVVLASASPRRRELLENAGIVFDVVVSPAEEIHDASMPPETLCELNAALKAEAVAEVRPDATVIGADTLVFIDGEPLGKPTDIEEARARGAMALFTAKYGEQVKVYTMGDFSMEVCGGPHANNTGELGGFKIQKEESSSAGVRRIKAVILNLA